MKSGKTLLVTYLAVCGTASALFAQGEIFSGPQVDEKLTPFKAKLVFGEDAGEEFDPIASAKDGPCLVLFVHEFNRPSVGLLRTVIHYASSRKKDGLHSSVVFLGQDATATENRLKRAQHALPKNVQLGISVDGQEGPGAYGLNRNVTITALVGNKNKVTSNFALVQPSIPVDAPKIGKAISEVLGDKKPPTLADMGGRLPAMTARGRMSDERFRALMGPVIRKDASQEQVEKAAKAVEDLAAKNRAFRIRVHQVASRIVGAGKLENYGTSHAQEFIKKWAKPLDDKDPPPKSRDKTEDEAKAAE